MTRPCFSVTKTILFQDFMGSWLFEQMKQRGLKLNKERNQNASIRAGWAIKPLLISLVNSSSMSIQPLQVAGRKIIYYGEQSQNLASRTKMTQQRFSSWATILNRHKMTTALCELSTWLTNQSECMITSQVTFEHLLMLTSFLYSLIETSKNEPKIMWKQVLPSQKGKLTDGEKL